MDILQFFSDATHSITENTFQIDLNIVKRIQNRYLFYVNNEELFATFIWPYKQQLQIQHTVKQLETDLMIYCKCSSRRFATTDDDYTCGLKSIAILFEKMWTTFVQFDYINFHEDTIDKYDKLMYISLYWDVNQKPLTQCFRHMNMTWTYDGLQDIVPIKNQPCHFLSLMWTVASES